MVDVIDRPEVRARVEELLAEYGVPSAQIGVLRDGEITDFAVGVKAVATGEPATTDTIYQCGSLSKAWTALALMRFVDEGRVDLDAPVRTYLPGFAVADPDVSANVTPRHLLNHTNGIEESFGDPGEGEDVYERMVENITDAQQVHPLGYTLGYSAALGSAILGRVMEVVDRRRWDDVMEERLFRPLGLIGTSSWKERVDPARAATGHIVRSMEEGPVASPWTYLPRSYGPGGNVNSTARDVLTMARVFLEGGKAPNGTQIVSPELAREMVDFRVPIPEPYMLGEHWGLGLVVSNWHGETVFGHDGSTGGQTAHLRVLPDSGLAIAVMLNGMPRLTLYRRLFNELLRELGAVTIPDWPEPNPTLELDVSKYVGRYARPENQFEVSADGGTLYLTFIFDPRRAEGLGKPPRVTYELAPISETNFLMLATDPMEDTQPLAIYDIRDGTARYLHMTFRAHPRVDD
jgi:CubicO group peptidase (beta-lactamase class C family)